MIPKLIPAQAGSFRIWDPPIKTRKYVIGIDVAEGKVRDRTNRMRRSYSYSDRRPDYSAAVILELESGSHVATWHGYADPPDFAAVCAAMGWHYGGALLVPELNGPGLVVVTELTRTFKYTNLYQSRTWNRLEGDFMGNEFGFRTTVQSRKVLIGHIYRHVNSDFAFTRDERLISELRTMEMDDNGIERARAPNNDDLVMALGLALTGRYEYFHGTIHADDEPGRRLDEFDRKVWRRLEAHGNRRDGRTVGGRVRPPSRPGRLAYSSGRFPYSRPV